jgi:hypothetical protein
MIPDIGETSSNVLVEIPEKEVMLQESRHVSHAARILKNDIEIKSNYYCMSGRQSKRNLLLFFYKMLDTCKT